MTRICPSCKTVFPDDARFCGRCASPLLDGDSVSPPDKLAPDTILHGRYVIQRQIARGGMSAVYLAADQRMPGKQWAIKEMAQQALGPSQELEAHREFRREAEMLAALSHANLPLVVDFFNENDKYYLVMEFVQGETLAQILERQGALSESTVLEWAYQLCDVLSYLHRRPDPIIFRDLKPANIMLTADDRIKLIDFGIARHFQPSKGSDTQRLGTPGYAAPEQYGQNQSDERTDIYGLGATLHHLLSGRDPSIRPFDFPTLRDLAPHISQRTASAVDRAVQHEPADRFPSIEALRSAMPPLTGEEGGGKRKTIRPWLWAAAGFISVFLLALFAWFVWPGLGQVLATETPEVVAPPPLNTEEPRPSLSPVTSSPEGGATPMQGTATSIAVIPTDAPPKSSETPTPPSETPIPTPTASMQPTLTPTPTSSPELGSGADLVGYSHNGEPIEVYRFGSGPTAIVLIGGLHYGFAPSSTLLATQAVAHFSANADEVPEGTSLYVIPNMNPDGIYAPGVLRGRTNARGVDLNRNWGCEWQPDAEWDDHSVSGGSAPFSEPETVAVRDWLLALRPQAIIFYEARAANGLVTPGSCDGVYSGSDTLMNIYWTNSNYRWLDGLAVTGDASNWAAREGMAAIFVILRSRDALSDSEWQRNLRAIHAVLNHYHNQ